MSMYPNVRISGLKPKSRKLPVLDGIGTYPEFCSCFGNARALVAQHIKYPFLHSVPSLLVSSSFSSSFFSSSLFLLLLHYFFLFTKQRFFPKHLLIMHLGDIDKMIYCIYIYYVFICYILSISLKDDGSRLGLQAVRSPSSFSVQYLISGVCLCSLLQGIVPPVVFWVLRFLFVHFDIIRT